MSVYIPKCPECGINDLTSQGELRDMMCSACRVRFLEESDAAYAEDEFPDFDAGPLVPGDTDV